MNFAPLTLDDVGLVRRYFNDFGSGLCDYTVGGTVMWRDYFGTCFAEEDGVLYFRTDDGAGGHSYSMPVTPDDAARLAGLDALARQARGEGQRLVISKISSEHLPMVVARFPDAAVESDPDWFDYVYDSAEFIALRGKKYSGQRNHINQFQRTWPDWRAETVGPDDLAAVSEFFTRYAQSRDKIYDSFYAEEEKVREVLEHMEVYGFFGTALWAGGRVVAFSMGEVQGDTLFVHIEKADRNCPGAYQMISHCFAEQWGGNVRFLNREEDVGDEGLRISKQSYHPVKLLEKFTIRTDV